MVLFRPVAEGGGTLFPIFQLTPNMRIYIDVIMILQYKENAVSPGLTALEITGGVGDLTAAPALAEVAYFLQYDRGREGLC